MRNATADLFYFEEDEVPKKKSIDHSPFGDIPSILKWTGSKRSQASRIAAYAPQYARYYEPFLGGGAMMYLLAGKRSIGADIYSPLIAFWNLVRDKPETLIMNYAEQWKELQADFPSYFYVVRDRFNLEKRPEDLNFLMRTCVNGIVRFSKKGDFNNSFHLSRKGMLPDRFRQIVKQWSHKTRTIEFRVGDFEKTTVDATSNDFVYLDPPYAGNKQRYISDLNVQRFYEFLEDLNCRGVRWALSFDGARGQTEYDYQVPSSLFKRCIVLDSGYSAVAKVLNGPVEMVTEKLYLSY